MDVATLARSPQTTPASSGTGRLIGLDVARALAVIGMFAAHTMPGGWLHDLVSGRAAALFAVLAGVSIALMSGGSQLYDRLRLRSARVRIAVRAVLLFVLGLALTTLQVPAMVILAFYAVLFALSLPLLRLRAPVLAALAAVFAIGGPLLSFVLRKHIETNKLGYTPDFTDLTSPDGLWQLAHGLLLTGAYPALTWLPFLLAGMAVGRLDLRALRGRLMIIGVGLGALGYGGSVLVMQVFGVREHLISLLPPDLPPQMLDVVMSAGYGTVSTTDPAWLLTAAGHSGTPFEIVGASGVAMAVIGLCLLADRRRFEDRLRVVLLPLASVGSLALTAYVGHLVALRLFGQDHLEQALSHSLYLPWLVLVAAALVFCTTWRALLGRGPLERVLHHTSTGLARLADRRRTGP